MSLNQTLLPEFDLEMASLRKTLLRVSPEKFDAKPHPKSWTMLQLALHLTEIAQWTAFMMSTDGLDIGVPFDRPAPPTDNDELIRRLDKNIAETRTALEAATDEQLMAPWTLRMGDHVIFTLPKIAVHRSTVMNHMIHHRGQLCVYFRLNEIPVPGLYGPSADEQ